MSSGDWGGLGFMVEGRMAVAALNGWLLVAVDALADDADLARWVGRGVAYARSLPPKSG